jgi:hypothetical protein
VSVGSGSRNLGWNVAAVAHALDPDVVTMYCVVTVSRRWVVKNAGVFCADVHVD